MPYKDPEKRKQAAVAFHKKMYYGAINFCFRRDTESDIQEALEEAVAAHNVKPAVYARIATIEKLIRDGFLLGILNDDEPKEEQSSNPPVE